MDREKIFDALRMVASGALLGISVFGVVLGRAGGGGDMAQDVAGAVMGASVSLVLRLMRVC